MAPLVTEKRRSLSVSSLDSDNGASLDMALKSLYINTRSRARSLSIYSSSDSDSDSKSDSDMSESGRSGSRSPMPQGRAGRNVGRQPGGALRSTGGGKVNKRKKTQRLTMTKTKRAYKPKKDAIEKVLREEANSRDLLLGDLPWSRWSQVIRRKAPTHSSATWTRRHPDHVGYRRATIATDTNKPAVYEFAVATPENTKVPVLGSVTMGMNGRHWEGAMLAKPKLRAQIDRVLRRGCKVYARKAKFSAKDLPAIYERCPNVERKQRSSEGSHRRSRVTTAEAVNELRGLMMKVHDYAWRDHYDVESRTYSHRPLTVDGVKLSD